MQNTFPQLKSLLNNQLKNPTRLSILNTPLIISACLFLGTALMKLLLLCHISHVLDKESDIFSANITQSVACGLHEHVDFTECSC